MEKIRKQVYDLEERLLEYSVRILKVVEQLPNSRVGNHVAGQLLKLGTSPYSNHCKAQAAESPKDFIHKILISLKELRESQRWLKLIQRVPLIKKPELLDDILQETIAKRSAINIGRSMLNVRCSTFELFTVPAGRSFIKETNLISTFDLPNSAFLYTMDFSVASSSCSPASSARSETSTM